MTKKYVYLFNEYDQATANCGDDWEGVRSLLGGKGANLLDATRLGIPVPPGFTVTTEGCNDYLEAGEEFPGNSWDQILESISTLEEQTGKKFGDPDNPLLVLSHRFPWSSARMPFILFPGRPSSTIYRINFSD